MKVVLGLSGGMDSATLCGFYLEKGYEVIPVSFNYQSKHNIYENKAASDLAYYWGLTLLEIKLPFINELFSSNLLKNGGEIPEGHYQEKSMSLTVVPGRNIIFSSIMAGIAWSKGASVVALGVHSGDHAIYEDCRPEFISAINTAIIVGSGGRVSVEAPFLHLDKAQILNIGYRLAKPIPYKLTRTCYKDQELSCGKCGSCQERIEAFSEIGIKDPVRYDE